MQHWYVYHSKATMGCDYKALDEAGAYSKKKQSTLLLGDAIWVVEGPGEFALVDCFLHTSTDYRPLSYPFGDFELKAKGASLIKGAIPLDASLPWFKELHSRYITKQRFFERVEGPIVAGFQSLSGVTP
jgi:hypothetical protein